MTRFLMMALLGSTAFGSAALAQTPPPPAAPPPPATSNPCKDLVDFLQQRGSAQPASPVTLDQARGFESSNNTTECRDGIGRIRAAGITLPANLAADATQKTADQPGQPAEGTKSAEGARVTVQNPAAQVRVQEAQPQVTVQQAQPQVTVHQPQPEITVHQPAPTITVDIPQPEITVKMPQPTVNVAMAQPQVSVNQAKPQVQVVQPSAQQPVQVQHAAGQPNVQVVPMGNGKPQVTYDRAQPKVVVNQAQGQPQVKVESAGATPPSAAPTPPAPTPPAPTPPAPAPAPASAPAPAPDAGTAATQQMTVSTIDGKDLYNAQGNKLGDIEHVVQGQDGKDSVVIGHGGFLGLGQKNVTIPLESIAMKNNRLTVQGVTDEQIKTMPTWDNNSHTYKMLDGNQSVPVATAQ